MGSNCLCRGGDWSRWELQTTNNIAPLHMFERKHERQALRFLWKFLFYLFRSSLPAHASDKSCFPQSSAASALLGHNRNSFLTQKCNKSTDVLIRSGSIESCFLFLSEWSTETDKRGGPGFRAAGYCIMRTTYLAKEQRGGLEWHLELLCRQGSSLSYITHYNTTVLKERES